MKDDRIYLEHIQESITKIEKYLKGIDYDAYLEDSLLQDAIVRQLEIIGEATKRISSKLKEDNPHVPWSDMAGMRDVLIHDYIDVDLDIVWKTASESIIELKKLLSSISHPDK